VAKLRNLEVAMCPFCWATLGLVVAGAASGGGLAALALIVSRSRNAEEGNTKTGERSARNGGQHDRSSENSVTR
jgi:hypothetical protein